MRSSRWRRFVHVPLGKAGVHLLVRCRRYGCRMRGGAWEDDLSRVGAGGRRLTESAVWWALASVALDAMSVRSVAMTLGCSWDCANDAVLSKGVERLIGDEHRLDGVAVIGVDEHVWRHTSRGSRYVTVVVDLAPRSEGRPARLLDVVEGRGGTVFAGWLVSRSEEFRTCGSWRWTRSLGTRRRSGRWCRTPGRSSTRSTSSGSPATSPPNAADASNRSPPAGAARGTTRLQSPTRPAEGRRHPHRPATLPSRPAVRERRQRAVGGHVGRLPEDNRLLRRTRPAQGARHDATGSSTASTPDPPTRPASRGH